MVNPTEQDLIRWRDAGVLFEFSDDGHIWRVGTLSYLLTERSEYRYVSADNAYRCIRPYRAAGHIQPHDGSAERPEGVPENAWVLPMLHRKPYTSPWWSSVAELASDVPWIDVLYFIILPEVKSWHKN